MKQRLKFAIVGYGHIGKRHAEVISGNHDCELIAIVDVRPKEELSDIDQYDNVTFFGSIEEFLTSEVGRNVEVVNIATPNGLHADQAIQCLMAKKHVILEKPMALNATDAQRLIAVAMEVGKHVFVVMQNRYSSPCIWLKQLLAGDKLGKVFLVQINCFWNRDERYYQKGSWHGSKQLDGGTLFTQFSHFVDLMYWYFGDISNIQTKFRDFSHQQLTDFEDTGVLSFDFVNGGIGCFSYSTAVWGKNLESSITVIAEKGSLKVTGQYLDNVAYCHIKDYAMQGPVIETPVGTHSGNRASAINHEFVVKNVVDVILNNSPINHEVGEGLKIVEIIERIYKSNVSFKTN